MSTVHIVGAGLAGLAAAADLADRGVQVKLYEGAGHAGGRCRSFFDKTLERKIDNGNHLIMSGNRHALKYLKRTGSTDKMEGPAFATYPFVDIKTGQRWTIRINEGPIPFWVFDPQSRIPDTKVSDYLGASKIMFSGADQTVTDAMGGGGLLFSRFWEPLTLAVLNTTPQIGQAKLLWSVIRETFLLGGQACRPLVATEGLGAAFIDPTVGYLKSKGVDIQFNRRLRSVEKSNDALTALVFQDETVQLAPADRVILALPPSRLKSVMPEYDPPDDNASILNVHYRTPVAVPRDKMGGSSMIAMLSSDAHWAFVHGDVISLTVSAAHAIGLDDVPNAKVVDDLWRETQIALGLGDMQYEAVRVIRERRATFDQSPEGAKRRLKQKTAYSNLVLAGDHTDTGVPATIEGSIRSGDRAAGLVHRLVSP